MTGLPSMPSRDAGLQNERTTLAWVRTALALLATAALFAKQSADAGGPIALLVLAIVTALAMILQSERRHLWRAEALAAGDPVTAMRHLFATAVVACGLSATGLLIVVL